MALLFQEPSNVFDMSSLFDALFEVQESLVDHGQQPELPATYGQYTGFMNHQSCSNPLNNFFDPDSLTSSLFDYGCNPYSYQPRSCHVVCRPSLNSASLRRGSKSGRISKKHGTLKSALRNPTSLPLSPCYPLSPSTSTSLYTSTPLCSLSPTRPRKSVKFAENLEVRFFTDSPQEHPDTGSSCPTITDPLLLGVEDFDNDYRYPFYSLPFNGLQAIMTAKQVDCVMAVPLVEKCTALKPPKRDRSSRKRKSTLLETCE